MSQTETRTPDPFDCRGCHSGDFAGFDHFCDVLDVQTSELPHAFAAFLGGTTEWDGDYEPVAGLSDTRRRET